MTFQQWSPKISMELQQLTTETDDNWSFKWSSLKIQQHSIENSSPIFKNKLRQNHQKVMLKNTRSVDGDFKNFQWSWLLELQKLLKIVETQMEDDNWSSRDWRWKVETKLPDKNWSRVQTTQFLMEILLNSTSNFIKFMEVSTKILTVKVFDEKPTFIKFIN